MINVKAEAVRAIKLFLTQKGAGGPLRVELLSTGCCDASIGLRLDRISDSDLIQEVEGFVFVIDPETNRLLGEITISYVDENDRQGFLITSENTVSEWGGFGVSKIRF